jgi:tetratricopeptide (TPR) repeat protein
VGWVVLLAVAAAPAEAVFETRDLNRPLVLDRIDPELAEPLAGLYGLDPEAVRRSLAQAENARDSFDIHVYRATTAGLSLKYVGEALQEFPANPFAWVQFGADLALYQQPVAAITATEHGLDEIPDLDGLDGLDEATVEAVELLRRTAALNLALYRLMLDRYDRALDALQQAGDPAELDPLRRLVFYWTAARAYGGRGERRLAEAALKRAEGIPHEDLAAFQDSAIERKDLLSDSYPQYFKENLRRANQQYIHGLVELGAGDSEAAREALKAAVAEEKRLWDAQFALATALLLTGRDELARTQLEGLASVQLKKFYRPERIFFNLGNVERKAGRWQKAVEHYEMAIELAEKADGVFLKHYNRYGEAFPENGVAVRVIHPTLPGRSRTFPEARTNLALTYLELHQLKPKGRYDRRAEGELRRALEDSEYRDAYVARQRLTELYLNQERWREALDQISLTLQDRPTYSPALHDLFTLITELDDPALEIEATSVLVRALESMQPAYACRRYGSWVEAIRPRLAGSEDLTVAITAIQRLPGIGSACSGAERVTFGAGVRGFSGASFGGVLVGNIDRTGERHWRWRTRAGAGGQGFGAILRDVRRAAGARAPAGR